MKFDLGELEGEILDKLLEGSNHRHRDALRNAVAAAQIRYADAPPYFRNDERSSSWTQPPVIERCWIHGSCPQFLLGKNKTTQQARCPTWLSRAIFDDASKQVLA